MDIDAERLRTAELVAGRLVEAHGAGARVEATQDRRAALDGADYVVTSFQVGGYKPSTVIDFEVPKRYGLRQTIADTLGIGGIMRGLRTIPVLLDVCRDLEELARTRCCSTTSTRWRCCAGRSPRRARSARSGSATPSSTPRPSSRDDLGVPSRRSTTTCAGINHLAFFLRLERDGEDLYPALRRVSTARRTTTACATSCSSTSATSSPNPPSTSPSTCPGSSRPAART